MVTLMRNSNLAFLLLAIYLIIDGLTRLVGGSALGVVLGLLALAAGVLLLLAYLPDHHRAEMAEAA